MATDLIDRYDAFALDIDGVVLRGTSPIPGAGDALARIRDSGKPLLLLTNNAAYDAISLARLVAGTGFEPLPEELLTSAMVLRSVIERQHPDRPPAFVMGPPNLSVVLESVVEKVPIASGKRVELVAIGRETLFDFKMLHAASDAVREGAAMYACNRDATLPVERGFEPGTGAIVAAIEVASGVPARIVGKPSRDMMDEARQILGGGRVLMVGDRPDSDVAGARAVGFDAALVLSGVASSAPSDELAPDHVLTSVAEL